MTDYYIGHHINISHGLVSSADYAKSLGANFYQIFLTSPQSYNRIQKPKEELIELKNKLVENKMKIVIHGSYMLNFCNEPSTLKHKSALKLLKADLNDSIHLGALGVVIHMGKKLDLDEETAINNYVIGLKNVLKETPPDSIIILETGAGVGSEVCTSFTGLENLLNRFDSNEKKRIKFCIDTCHIFSAGYDVGNEDYVDVLDNLIEAKLGWKNVAVIHLNDSKNKLNTKKDNHADIGKGNISIDGLKKFVKLCSNKKIPIVLETPCDLITKKNQIEMVKGWVTK